MTGKKSFVGQQNPALAFISTQEPPEGQTESEEAATMKEPDTASSAAHVKTADAPEGYKANPLFVETKSRRIQLLMQPSLYDAIKARATARGQSVNELIHSILEAAVREG